MLIFDQLKKNDPQLRFLAAIVLTGVCVLLAGLWWVQVVRVRDYQSHLERQSFRPVRVPAVRGKILDRNGEVLAENRPNYNVSLYLEELRPQFDDVYDREFQEKKERMIAAREKELGRPLTKKERRKLSIPLAERNELRRESRFIVASNIISRISGKLALPISVELRELNRHYAKELAVPYTVVENLDPTNIARFEEQCTGLAGVDLEIRTARFYPQGTTASHVLGYVRYDDSSAKGEDAYFWYRPPDYRGVVGVEGFYDHQLRGRAGSKSVLVNNLSYRESETMLEEPQPGDNVILTIDLPLQRAAEKAMRERVGPMARGAVVIMDVHSGDVLALASFPSGDPNHFIQGFSDEERAFWNDPTLRPQINRATQENYAPGSIFKPLIGLACLEAGMDHAATIYNPPHPRNANWGHIVVRGRTIRDLAKPGEYDFTRGLMHSSNTYFITNGLRYAGIQNIIKLGQRVHLGERCNLPTWQETSGNFPSLKQVSRGWSDGQTANLCIGQGLLDVTPLQMAVMTSAIANGGKVLWPRLVARIEPQDPLSDEEPKIFPAERVRDHLAVHPRNLDILRRAMLADTEDPGGTAYRAFREYYRNADVMRVCGKTGTAEIQNVHGQTIDQITWFISFAPFEEPRYAVVVMVESGGSGGGTCAPVARDIFNAIKKLNSPAGNPSMARAE